MISILRTRAVMIVMLLAAAACDDEAAIDDALEEVSEGDEAYATAGTWTIANWNIQHGWGEGWGSCPYPFQVHSTGGAVTGPMWNASARPIQAKLSLELKVNNSDVVAIGLTEASTYATPGAVRTALGWAASYASNRDGIVARYGFAPTGTGVNARAYQGVAVPECDANKSYSVAYAPVCVNSTCTKKVAFFVARIAGGRCTTSASQRLQAQKVVDFVKAKRGSLPAVLVGDFNAEPGSTVVNTFTGGGMRLATPDATTCCLGTRATHARKFDLVFTLGGPAPLFAPWTKNNGPVTGASCALADHAMVLARFPPL